jgi:hypothetical protein
LDAPVDLEENNDETERKALQQALFEKKGNNSRRKTMHVADIKLASSQLHLPDIDQATVRRLHRTLKCKQNQSKKCILPRINFVHGSVSLSPLHSTLSSVRVVCWLVGWLLQHDRRA